MIESGRWPGLEQAIEESERELGEQDDLPPPEEVQVSEEGQRGA